MNRLRIVFFGIYGIGVHSLESLEKSGIRPVAVVTKPSAGGQVQPVAEVARERGLLLLQPDSPREEEFIRTIGELAPDLIAVAGYHKIIPEAVLDIPTMGTINLHGSLLPRYRGPCTWKWAIANGETVTGVTVHVMTPILDNGDILAQREIPIDGDDTGATLFGKISLVGGELLAETIAGLEAGRIEPRPQDESEATYYGYPGEADTRIDWEKGAEEIRNLVRGMSPGPGAWTSLDGRVIRVLRASVGDGGSAESPGTLAGSNEEGVSIATSTADLIVHEVCLDGEPPSPPGPLFKKFGIRLDHHIRFGS